MKNYERDLFVNRIYEQGVDRQTIGNFFVVGVGEDNLVFKGVTIELPWKNNEKNVSCIPTGSYLCEKYWSWTFKTTCFRVLEVPNRSNIAGHPANFYSDLRGCIGFGETFTDINSDGYLDITNSRKTVKKLMKELPSKFRMEVS